MDEKEQVPKYKVDSCIKHKNALPPIVSREKFELEQINWKVVKDPGHNNFEEFAKELITKHTSFNLDGRAGTGKSTLIKNIKKVLEETGKKFKCLAPTNKACRIIGGETLHKFFLKVQKTKKEG